MVLVFGFYLISCNDSGEIIESNTNDSLYVSVTVLGEVKREGEFVVPSSWTLEDLLNYVGVKNTADLNVFNLEEYVIDGMVYEVGSVSINNINHKNKININTANKEELMTLKGIGETIASKIINYRNNTPFTRVEDIKNVSGIGDAMYEKIKDFITV